MSAPDPLLYRVKPIRPAAHLFAVELEIPAGVAGSAPLTVGMPAWIPGSYMIRDFARNIVAIGAEDDRGPLPLTKLDKQTWQLGPASGALRLRWQVYAWDLSVRAAHLDGTHGYFNGPGLFLRLLDHDALPCRLELVPPDGPDCADWRVATSLHRDGAEPWGFGGYRAADYDELIDHPVEMGRFDLVSFEVGGVPHWMTITGRHRADLDRLARDLPAICEQQAALFGELPVDRYLFLTMAVGTGYGGLEHRWSSSLLCSRDELPRHDEDTRAANAVPGQPSPEYRRFLALCSHEYFHLWNVKRIRPEVLQRGGLEREVHTRLLWAFEGITSYYDELMLLRSGRIDLRGYLDMLAETVTRVMRNPGRLRQTVAESSFDAWTRFYKQDENAPNAIVSYYAKGALVALALDLTIRHQTDGARTLDDVMRALWQRYGRTGVGVPERGVEAVAAEIAGVDLDGFFARALDGTEDLDLTELLAGAGIMLRLRPAKGPKDVGGCVERFDAVEPRPDIGVRLDPEASAAKLAVVLDDRPAQRAGLSAGDEVVAVDGLRANAANLEALIGAVPAGEVVTVHAFRRDELMAFEVQPEPAPADTCELRLLPDPPEPALRRRVEWLGTE
jgi:predicted metalloprotease with PDZ domain